MEDLNHRIEYSNHLNLAEGVRRYAEGLNPRSLGVREIRGVSVSLAGRGTSNLNYLVEASGKKFLFRVNIEPQSGLRRQVEYEYGALAFLDKNGAGFAPKPYFFDDSREKLPFGLLVEEYFEGPQPRFSLSFVENAARLLARLHAVRIPKNNFFVKVGNPLVWQYAFISKEFGEYEKHAAADARHLRLTRRIMSELKKIVVENKSAFEKTGKKLVHTDLCLHNFIQTRGGLKLVDWEKPRLDDACYDLCQFLTRTVQFWDSRRGLTENEKKAFAQEYARASGDETIAERVRVRLPLVEMHPVLQCSISHCRLLEGSMPKELAQDEATLEKYEKFSSLEFLRAAFPQFA